MSVAVAALFLLLVVNLTPTSTPYRILVVYPTPANSHQRGQQAITQKLAEIGHEVTLISPLPPLKDHRNIAYINVSEIIDTKKEVQEKIGKQLTNIEMFKLFRLTSTRIIEIFMKNPDVQHLMQEKPHFDAVIVELTGYTTLHAFGPFFNAPLIGLAPLETSQMIYRERGNPTHPVLHPGLGATHTGRPNFMQRVLYTYKALLSCFLPQLILYPVYDDLTKKYFNYTFNSIELIRMIDFHIEEVSPVVQNVRPLLPNTVQIGFMHIDRPKSLSEDLQTFMDSSARGVIYVSFGSTFTSIEPSLVKTLQETFAHLDYDVIWKWESDTMEGKPVNVKLMKWTPQLDLLAHKNLRVFITQGGAQSMQEFIARGVPAIVIPMYGDQEHNAVLIEKLGIGKFMLKEDVTKHRLVEAITEVITNSSYRERTRELYRLAMDTPLPPLDTAVWWIEYIIRNKGASHLKYPGADMPWYQWLLIDFILLHVVLLLILFWILRKAHRCVSMSQKIKED